MSKVYNLFIVLILLLAPSLIYAQELPVVEFFYLEGCSHCSAEDQFLSTLENIEINSRPVSKEENVETLLEFYKKYDVPQDKWGLVPVTFIGTEYFIGFDGSEQVEDDMRMALFGELPEKTEEVVLPVIRAIDPSKYSLPVLTVLMGVLDGFNVCSLGALLFILGLVLSLKSRKKIFLYGGLFVLTTAIVYGLLIVLWYKLFVLLSSYLRIMEIVIAVMSFFGAGYFLREFIRMKRYGPTCESSTDSQIGGKLMNRVREVIGRDGAVKPLALIGAILLFSVVITVIEFPCSAAVPVVYAGILSNANLPALSYLVYIFVFVLFYLLDELIVFGIAATKMTIWLNSPKFVIWITLVESVVLLLLGSYYLFGF